MVTDGSLQRSQSTSEPRYDREVPIGRWRPGDDGSCACQYRYAVDQGNVAESIKVSVLLDRGDPIPSSLATLSKDYDDAEGPTVTGDVSL